jgi:glucan biosynthesis protein C
MKNPVGITTRLYYLDWLRVLAMGGVFFFHNARFFDGLVDWHVKNASTNLAASAIVAFMSQWVMPLFFLIAGAGTYYALKARRISRFAQERIMRLLIPFLFGMLVIVVPQAYFQAVFHGEQLSGYNFFQIYGLYFQSLPGMQTFHLWFLLDLFTISIITLPLFLTRKSSGNSIISKLAIALDKPWLLIPLFVLSLALLNIFLYPAGEFGDRGGGGFNRFAYMLFYIFGYLIFSNPRIMEAFKKLQWYTLAIGVITFVLIVTLFLDEIADPIAHFGTTAFALAHFVQALGTWCWLIAILVLGSRLLQRNNKFLSYANEAVLPFYVLHQTIIISIGFYVIQWSSGVGLKYLTISTTSFIAIMLLYELLVRRINLLRFLFGMRLKRKPQAMLITEDQT